MKLRGLAAVVAGILAITGITQAQTEYDTRRDDVQALTERDYNIRIGEIQLDFIGRSSLTYDDNVYRTNSNTQEGTTMRLGLDTGIFWPINADMLLDMRLGIGYTSVISGEGNDGVSIRAAETGSLSFDMLVGDNGLLSLVDTLTVQSITESFSDVEDQANYRQLENDLALQYEVNPSPIWDMGLRIGRRDLRVLDDSDYDHRNLTTYYAAGHADYEVNANLDIGPYVSYRMYEYQEGGNNDGSEWEAGMRGIWEITEFTVINASLGWQAIDIDDDSGPGGLSTSQNDPTWRIGVDSELSDNIRHGARLTYQHNISGTRGVNFTEDFMARYHVGWRINPTWSVNYSLEYLMVEELAVTGEEYDAIANTLRVTWLLATDMTLYGEYRRADKDSDINRLDYSQNSFTLGFSYNF